MPRVVIVGAGVGGIGAFQTLAKKLSPGDSTEVVVFEKSAFFYHTFGASRAFTDASFNKFMFAPFDNAIPARASGFVRRVRGVVTRINADTNTVEYNAIGADDDQPSTATQSMAFDYLILATGSTYAAPVKQDPAVYSRAHTERQLEQMRERIAQADKILVVGGGPLACEVAADIAGHHPTKHVTLVSKHPQLVSGDDITDSFRTKLMATLTSMNVRLVMGEQLTERLTDHGLEPRELRTDKGTVIASDVQILCAGFSPSGELVQAMDPSLVDRNGAIRVNDQLQLDDPKYAHMFALGDANNHATPKTGGAAYHQGVHVATELALVLHNKQKKVVKPFPKRALRGLLLPLGPTRGITQLPFFGGVVCGDWFTQFVFGDMGVSKTWGALGASPPS